jgi:arylsulfatase A-like enzyme
VDKPAIQSKIKIGMKSVTFWQFFRLVFLLFSLYLIGDVFYRWDGFKFHSSFSEFLPSVALVSIIWSILAVFTAFIVWVPLKVTQRLCEHLGLKIKTDHLMLYSGVFAILSALAWIGKKLIWSNFQTSFQLKLTMIIFISCAAIPVAWLFRNKAGQWINTVQQRITPIVWLFGIFVMLSVPFVILQFIVHNKTISPAHSPSADSKTNKNRPNILLITFDALTARKMSVYGYSRPTTPFIKEWAKTASVFTRTEAESNYTTATTASLMTGKRVWTHRKYQHDIVAKPVKIETENLALILKENGYYNSAYIANIITTVDAVGISRSVDISPSITEFTEPASIESLIEKYLRILFGTRFNIYNWIGQDDFIFTIILRRIPQSVFLTEFPPELAFNKFLEVIDKNPREPFFAWIHVLPPHDPLSPPKPFAGLFNSSWKLREKNVQLSIRPEIKKYYENDLPYPEETQRKVNMLRDYYDEFILYCDKQFEDFMKKVQKRNWAKDTVIILSSDHGDSYEHNYFLHNGPHLYEQVTHIPLIIKKPDQTGGEIINNLVEQIDIPATILDLSGIPVPPWMEGRSLAPLLDGKDIPSKALISVNLFRNIPRDPITNGTIAVWEGDYKLIHYLNNKSLLFNLKEDPDELTNLFDKETGTAQRLLALVKDRLKEANEKIIRESQE